ncbi:MAG: methyltransferase [Gammaproteobacteria bacterium]|nr:methyltransferase [Gammaproteobacteria bacterium]
MTQETLLKAPQGEFRLQRFPQRQKELLRAWDSADELILEHFSRKIKLGDNPDILIVNDSFGALTVSLNKFNPVAWSDSYISHQAIKANLHLNKINIENSCFLSSLETPKAPVDLAIIKIPKTLALLEDQLIKLQPLITNRTLIVAGGMIKSLTPNIWKLFERIIGPTSTSLARKKARLIFVTPDINIKQANNPYPVKYTLENTQDIITNHANVFSRDQLDIGTRFFLQNLPEEPVTGDIIDLGCGNGILGITMKKRHPEARVHFVDESYMAIASAKENYQAMHGTPKIDHFHTSDCLSDFAGKTVDLILCNPPFHQHNAVSDHIAMRMLKQSRNILRDGGELWLIGNRHLKYHHYLNKIFSNYSIVASNSKFVIYRSLV